MPQEEGDNTGRYWIALDTNRAGEREGKGKGHKYCAHRRNRQLAVSHGYPLAHVSARRKRKRRRPGGDLFSWPLAGQQCPEKVGCARTR